MYMFLFKDPKIELELFGEPSPYESENSTRFFFGISCQFDEAAGSPHIAITIDGKEGEILSENSMVKQSANYFYGHHFAAMWLGSNAVIVCSVTDDIGNYFVSHSVTINGEFSPKIGTAYCKRILT